jgi:hypothetical protein
MTNPLRIKNEVTAILPASENIVSQLLGARLDSKFSSNRWWKSTQIASGNLKIVKEAILG